MSCEIKVNRIKQQYEFYLKTGKERTKELRDKLDKCQAVLLKYKDIITLEKEKERVAIKDLTYWGDLGDKKEMFRKLNTYVYAYNESAKLKAKIKLLENTKTLEQFKFVCNFFNDTIKNHLIEGDYYYMKDNGTLYLKRVPRPIGRGLADPIASGKKRYELLRNCKIPRCPEAPNGHNWIEFYTDTHRAVVMWSKSRVRVPVPVKDNYVFVPTNRSNNKTFVSLIRQRLEADPQHMVNYIR